VTPRADLASVIPSPADRVPVVLDPYDSDLADLLALVRAFGSEDTEAVAFLLASGNAGLMLVTAVKLLAELTTDAASVEPHEMARRNELPVCSDCVATGFSCEWPGTARTASDLGRPFTDHHHVADAAGVAGASARAALGPAGEQTVRPLPAQLTASLDVAAYREVGSYRIRKDHGSASASGCALVAGRGLMTSMAWRDAAAALADGTVRGGHWLAPAAGVIDPCWRSAAASVINWSPARSIARARRSCPGLVTPRSRSRPSTGPGLCGIWSAPEGPACCSNQDCPS